MIAIIAASQSPLAMAFLLSSFLSEETRTQLLRISCKI